MSSALQPGMVHYCANCAFHEILVDGVYCAFCIDYFYTHGELPRRKDDDIEQAIRLGISYAAYTAELARVPGWRPRWFRAQQQHLR